MNVEDTSRRLQLTDRDLSVEIQAVNIMISKRLQMKGYGIMISQHEILGIIAEEYKEYVDEVQANRHDNQYKELLDIAVGAIIGMASIKSGKMDW